LFRLNQTTAFALLRQRLETMGKFFLIVVAVSIVILLAVSAYLISL